MKRVLMVAFHFPPAAASSGIQRTLRFVQNLPALGWEPVVLTAHTRAHERTNESLLADVPGSVRVLRSFALDTARHLAIGGRYPGFLAQPDRWQSWRFGAIAAGMRLLRTERFDAIWSTYPIATAHLIAATLQERSGLPWIADFRDPMVQDGYPADPKTWANVKIIEERAITNATYSVVTTPGAARLYRVRYPATPEDRIVVIENGYDEASFLAAEKLVGLAEPLLPGRLTLLHSGVVYPSERDPTQLLQALAVLKARGVVGERNFRVRFRATEHDSLIAELARASGVSDLVELAPAVPYKEALLEMLLADALLVMQASNCNDQVPAKLYEYMRARRPVLALTDPAGDTASVALRSGIRSVAALDSVDAITKLIAEFVTNAGERSEWSASSAAVSAASRDARAVELVNLLNSSTIQRGLA